MTWEVIVGNVGTVYNGTSRIAARRAFRDYVKISRSFVGRAGGENVCLLADSVVIEEYEGLGFKEG